MLDRHAEITTARYRTKRMTSFGNASGNISEQFRKYHEEHPEVYRILVSLAREAKRSGIHKYSISAIFEVARWKFRISKTGDFKLSNNYRSRYARLIMDQEDDLADFFTTRELSTL